MQLDPDDEGPPYTGSFVVLRGDGLGWSVLIEPRLPTGDGEPRTFACKHTAWGEARELWERHRLPFQDKTDGHTGHTNNKPTNCAE